jgi:hypothetical protein
MNPMSTCCRDAGLEHSPHCRATVGTLLCAWTRFVRLRQARHTYFNLTPRPTTRTAPSPGNDSHHDNSREN